MNALQKVSRGVQPMQPLSACMAGICQMNSRQARACLTGHYAWNKHANLLKIFLLHCRMPVSPADVWCQRYSSTDTGKQHAARQNGCYGWPFGSWYTWTIVNLGGRFDTLYCCQHAAGTRAFWLLVCRAAATASSRTPHCCCSWRSYCKSWRSSVVTAGVAAAQVRRKPSHQHWEHKPIQLWQHQTPQ